MLFGDGAGAVVLEIDEKDSDFGIRSSVLHADGAYVIFYMLMAARLVTKM